MVSEGSVNLGGGNLGGGFIGGIGFFFLMDIVVNVRGVIGIEYINLLIDGNVVVDWMLIIIILFYVYFGNVVGDV